MRPYLTHFLTRALAKLTPYWVLCLCFFSFITLVCIVIYLLVMDLAGDQLTLNNELHLLAYQLTILTLSSTIIFSVGLRIYFYKRDQRGYKHSNDNNNKSKNKNKNKNNEHSSNKSNNSLKAFIPPIDQEALQILIVDDNEANIMILENYLKASNKVTFTANNIFSANNGLDAITLFERESIDIILMDLEMDGMNGVQTLQHIRALEKTSPAEQQQRVPAIAVSAHSRETMQLKVLQQDFDDYLVKPVSQQSLFDTLQRWHSVASGIPENHEAMSVSASENVSQPTAKTIAPLTKPTITHPFPQKLKTVTSKQEDNLQKVVNIKLSLVHSNNNNQLARDMLQLLITMIDTEKDSLHFFYNEKDWEKMYQLNHKIYGGSSYCGVPELQQANKKLEMLLQRQLAFHEPEGSLTGGSLTGQSLTGEYLTTEDENIKSDDILCAIKEVNIAIDNILRWDKEYDIDVIFNLS